MKRTESGKPPRRTHTAEIIALLCVGIGLFLFVALFSYSPYDISSFGATSGPTAIRNLGGKVGAWIAELLIQGYGIFAFFFPVGLFYLGYVLTYHIRPSISTLLWGYAGFLLSATALTDLWFDEIHATFSNGSSEFRIVFYTGGWIGHVLAGVLRNLFGKIGSTILFSVFILSSIALMTSRNFTHHLYRFFLALLRAPVQFGRHFYWKYQSYRLKRLEKKALKELTQPHIDVTEPEDKKRKKGTTKRKKPKTLVVEEPDVSQVRQGVGEHPPALDTGLAYWEDEEAQDREAEKWYQQMIAERGSEGFVLPPLQMLTPPGERKRPSNRELSERATLIADKLAEFKISGEIVQALPGPVVTVYEFELAPSIKLSKVQALQEDLALALGVEAVRIDRMPKAKTIGIEVPNKDRDIIMLREVVESKAFQDARYPMPLAIGTNVQGVPYVAGLHKMPHLLIAGATGSGKSVTLNAIICSLLLRHTPEEIRLILIDPKMVELKLYNDIPHLYLPVISEAKEAASALKWLTREMEERQRLLAFFNVRNIMQYNKVIHTRRGKKLAERFGLDEPRHLPFIIVIIDEFADLMAVSSREVEDSIQRLAQMARAVGIHLIVATQRPSVDVITGVIKANFPCRIAFRVASTADSRTILDRAGAERLLGRGDMLFVPPESYKMHRLHGAYIAEQDIEKVVRFWKKQGRPYYSKEEFKKILAHQEKGYQLEGSHVSDDPLYEKAVQVVLESGKTSISYLQRVLRIGYNRAARLIEAMEEEGILSPPDGQGHRKIMKNE